VEGYIRSGGFGGYFVRLVKACLSGLDVLDLDPVSVRWDILRLPWSSQAICGLAEKEGRKETGFLILQDERTYVQQGRYFSLYFLLACLLYLPTYLFTYLPKLFLFRPATSETTGHDAEEGR
jgi:hypothetical protein